MSELSKDTVSMPPWKALHANIGELVKLWKAAHESTLGLHWKKLPPFSWFWPQVDFPRIQRAMETVQGHSSDQIKVAKKLLQGAQTIAKGESLRLYYETSIAYIEALAAAAKTLHQIAGYKQSKLKGEKVAFQEFNQVMLRYEEQIREMKTLAMPAGLAFNTLESSRNSIHP